MTRANRYFIPDGAWHIPHRCHKKKAALRGHWVVSFMMPASYTLETLPVPEDPNVTLRQVPVR
ncbi:heme-binding protein [Desulfobulbus alkaliphilus]|nr:heme-binding protein [Desulfobulbus alkaliphilus]